MGFISSIGRWRLTGVIVAIILLVSLTMIVGIGGSEGARLAVRFTARTSLILFLAAFVASALHHFWPGEFTVWLCKNRRYIGVAFAGSHLVHAIAIGAYIKADAHAFYASQQPIGYILNGLGYVFIIAMTATSFDAPARAIGSKAWKWLHLIGAYYIWFAFAKSYFPRAAMDGFYAPFASALVVALLIRLASVPAGRLWTPLRKR